MDRNSDRYRICPNDGVEFMAVHRGEKFCCPKCADEFHNEKKRLAAEQLIRDEIAEALKAPPPKLVIQEEVVLEEKVTTLPATPVLTSPLVSNISLISTILGDNHSLKVYKYYLTDRGFDYSFFENKYQIPNTDLFVLTYGPYAIAWGYENHIILTFKKNISWIQ